MPTPKTYMPLKLENLTFREAVLICVMNGSVSCPAASSPESRTDIIQLRKEEDDSYSSLEVTEIDGPHMRTVDLRLHHILRDDYTLCDPHNLLRDIGVVTKEELKWMFTEGLITPYKELGT